MEKNISLLNLSSHFPPRFLQSFYKEEKPCISQEVVGFKLMGFTKSKFEGIGWSVRLQQKRANFFLTLAKELVVGNALQKGDEVFYYLVNCEGRKAVLVFLDGQERPKTDDVALNGASFT
jgi:hypothetical protein